MSSPTSTSAFRRVGAADQIAEVLRARIVGGILRSGDQLVESELAREFDVSRNTVREGLRLLTREGLATHEVHRGVTVRTFSPSEVRDLYAVRGLVEREVATCVGQLTSFQVDTLRGLLDVATTSRADDVGADWTDHSMDFHRALVALLGNARLDAIFSELLRENQLVLSALPAQSEAHRGDQHSALVDILEHGQAQEFRDLVSTCLDHECAQVLRLMAEPAG